MLLEIVHGSPFDAKSSSEPEQELAINMQRNTLTAFNCNNQNIETGKERERHIFIFPEVLRKPLWVDSWKLLNDPKCKYVSSCPWNKLRMDMDATSRTQRRCRFEKSHTDQ